MENDQLISTDQISQPQTQPYVTQQGIENYPAEYYTQPSTYQPNSEGYNPQTTTYMNTPHPNYKKLVNMVQQNSTRVDQRTISELKNKLRIPRIWTILSIVIYFLFIIYMFYYSIFIFLMIIDFSTCVTVCIILHSSIDDAYYVGYKTAMLISLIIGFIDTLLNIYDFVAQNSIKTNIKIPVIINMVLNINLITFLVLFYYKKIFQDTVPNNNNNENNLATPI